MPTPIKNDAQRIENEVETIEKGAETIHSYLQKLTAASIIKICETGFWLGSAGTSGRA